ncbi:MAG TPA: GDSL-type esterase/lipase family protein [Phycisphaerae bacterium]|nr:GDSL-type esterase/lipase family protein [Phycisphaerae bacterium]
MIDAEAHYFEKLAAFKSESIEPGGIVLLGSSHFEWFDTAKFLPKWRFVNRGIVSDRIGVTDRGILHRLDVSVFDLSPACVILQNGVNDLGELWRHGEPSVKDIIACYEQVVARIKNRLPDTPFAIVSILPTTGDFAGITPWIAPFNVELKRIAKDANLEFIDFYPDVVGPDSQLRGELTYDGLHLNEDGYSLYAERLDAYLASLELTQP